jgi:hypothetical protein
MTIEMIDDLARFRPAGTAPQGVTVALVDAVGVEYARAICVLIIGWINGLARRADRTPLSRRRGTEFCSAFEVAVSVSGLGEVFDFDRDTCSLSFSRNISEEGVSEIVTFVALRYPSVGGKARIETG